MAKLRIANPSLYHFTYYMVTSPMTYLVAGESKKAQIKVLNSIFDRYFANTYSDMISKKDNPDIHILDGEGESSIGIEAVKDLQSELFFHPFEEAFQSAIIFEAEKLTREAQNALLKTLEESNDTTLFILCVKNEKNLLPTILSRSRMIFAAKGDEEEDIPEALLDIKETSIVEAFKTIEDISKDTDTVLDFLLSLENTYRVKMRDGIEQGEEKLSNSLRQKLEDIQIARERILGNGNKRLVLENLILRLKK